ncbi:hypothetical protein AN1V17_22210 [Vallitalea sediminicola]
MNEGAGEEEEDKGDRQNIVKFRRILYIFRNRKTKARELLKDLHSKYVDQQTPYLMKKNW